jgi:Nicotinic acid mononucleotide adenylyltransferase
MLDQTTLAVVQQIHDSSPRLVLEFAGAGSLGLFYLHAVGGSSRTILEATDRYSQLSLSDLLDRTPEQFVSVETAAAMAERAYERALLLSDGSYPLLGVSCTATIATDRTKRGDHRVFIGVRDSEKVTVYGLTLVKGLRERLGEEHVVSMLLLHAIAVASGITAQVELGLDPREQLETHVLPFQDPLAQLLDLSNQSVQHVLVRPDGRRIANGNFEGVLLSGSFNPLHIGHQRLLYAAAELVKQPAAFELPVLNADKGLIAYNTVLRRMAQFRHHATLLLSRAPLFTQKAALYPNCSFVVGYDTAVRLIAPRYYNNSEDEMLAAFAQLRQANCRFIVAGRLHEGAFLTLDDLNPPAQIADLFLKLPSELFRMDISSSELRARAAAEQSS